MITDREKQLAAENLAMAECLRQMLVFMKDSAIAGSVNPHGLKALCLLVDQSFSKETTEYTLKQLHYDALMAYATKLQVSSYNTGEGVNDFTDGYRQATLSIAHDMMRMAHEKLR